MPGSAVEAIADNDIFTGREVKRLLAEITRDVSPYVKIAAACEIMHIPRGTLKSRAPKYLELQQAGETPMIRVRRTSASRGAHWLFHEGDCWAYRREKGDCGVHPPYDSESPEACEDVTLQRYAHKVTAQWKRSAGNTTKGRKATTG